MAFLTKKDILNAKDLKESIVEVPEWGGQVKVRGLTATERDTFEHELFDQVEAGQKVSMKTIRANLCVRCIVDEGGTRLFDDKEIRILGTKSAIALDKVFKEAQKLSGLRKEDVEEIVKN